MKSCRLVILSTACLAGCLTSNGLQYESVSQNNLYHIAKIRKGMSEKEVIRIMHKPYSYESFQVGDDIYDVWFYVTRVTALDQTRMVPQNLTPLTFKNGILVGTEYYWYYYAMKEQAAEVAAQNGPVEKPKTQDQEDKEFEDALRSYPQKNNLPAQTTQAQPLEKAEMRGDPSIICKGMSESQVKCLIGSPIRTQTFELDGSQYSVWFYDTIPSKTGRLSTIPQKTTPVIFRNEAVISLSEDTYYKLKNRLECSAAKQPVEIYAAPTAPTFEKPSLFNLPSLLKPWKPLLGANKVELSKLHLGMSQAEVTDLLGSPDTLEAYQLNDDLYEVWFYPIAHSDSYKAPITFKNGVLVGMTDGYYEEVKQKGSKTGINGYDKPGERMQEEESEQNFNYW